jgi:acetoacetate decarboxylase
MILYDPDALALMPAHFGAPPHLAKPSAEALSLPYGDVTTVIIAYRTDAARLARFLPGRFRLAEEALITVSYCLNRKVQWLAGRSYNIISVDAAVVYDGEVDQVAGHYALVLWENLTDPILSGREIQGMPKIFADIDEPTVDRGRWRMAARHFGHGIVDLAVDGLQPVNGAGLEELRGKLAKINWMGWKHIPGTGFPKASAEVSHATLFPIAMTIDEAQTGTGRVTWHRATWDQNPTQYHIVNALADLPILEYRQTMITRGATYLAVANDPVRRLR